MEKQPLTRRFNVVDFLIVLIILALIAGGAYKLLKTKPRAAAQNATVRYQVLVENVRIPTVEALQEGQPMRDVQNNLVIGRIVGKEVSPYKQPVPTLDGKIVMADVPDKYNVLLTVEGPAVVTPANIVVGSTELKVGATLKFKTNYAYTTGIIYRILTPGTSAGGTPSAAGS